MSLRDSLPKGRRCRNVIDTPHPSVAHRADHASGRHRPQLTSSFVRDGPLLERLYVGSPLPSLPWTCMVCQTIGPSCCPIGQITPPLLPRAIGP
jgi:hypothetical protein